MPKIPYPHLTALALLTLLSLLFFPPLATHPLDTHDQDYFLDCADTLADPAYFFQTDKRMPGRPGLELVFLVQYALWGPNAAAFHLFGAFLHLLASYALFTAARRLGLDPVQALLAAGLFLINIAHFNAVHWISAQCYAVVLLCGCLALRYYQDDRPLPVYALLLFALANHIAAAVFLPFYLYLSWRTGDPLPARLKHYAPLGLLLAAGTFFFKAAFPQAPQAGLVAPSIDPPGILHNLLIAWSRLFTTAHWLPFPLHTYPSWEWLIGGIGLASFAYFQWRHHKPLSLWHAWILLHLLPPLLLAPDYIRSIPSGPSRYLYLASAGSSGLLAWGLYTLAQLPAPAWRTPLLTTLALTLTACSYMAHTRAEAVTFYAAARNYLAFGQIDQGTAQMRRAIATAPDAIDLQDAYVRLVPMLFNSGAPDAEAVLASALDRFPQNHTLRLIRLAIDSLDAPGAASAAARQKLDSFKRAKGVSRLLGEVYYHLGRGHQKNGDRPKAVAAYRRSLEFTPRHPQTLKSLTTLLTP